MYCKVLSNVFLYHMPARFDEEIKEYFEISLLQYVQYMQYRVERILGRAGPGRVLLWVKGGGCGGRGVSAERPPGVSCPEQLPTTTNHTGSIYAVLTRSINLTQSA